MESESIVDYLKSSLGKPWPVVAASTSLNGSSGTTTMQIATQLDGLYPEWDEFYLSVCDICGIIIRPQALEKHLATNHQIDNNYTNTLNCNDIRKQSSSSSSTSSSSYTSASASINQNNYNNAINSNDDQSFLTTNGFFDPTFYGLEPLTPSSLTTNPSPSLPLPSNTLTRSTSSSAKYQDRKWRNTFNVLKDAFF